MKIIISGYKGYESECEVEIIRTGEPIKSFHVESLNTTLTMDADGHGKVRIDTIKCVDYDEDENPIPVELTSEEYTALQNELKEYVDWNEWIDDQRPDDDDYEERRLSQLD